MTRIESVRRERQQTKHMLRAKIAKQESINELNKKEEKMRRVEPDKITYITLSE
jgi:hypothetical protein